MTSNSRPSGLSHGYEEVIVRGEPTSRSFSVIYLRESCIAGLDCVNSVKDYVQGKQLVARRMMLPEAKLADSRIPLKDL